MLGLPDTAAVGQTIPKKKFYEQLGADAPLRRRFVEQIERIVWKYKLAPTTANIQPGEKIGEVEVFEIELREKDVDIEILRRIDKSVPYPILFLLTYEGLVQACVFYKEITAVKSKDDARVKQVAFYRTEWLEPDLLPCRLAGIDVDSAYEQFVRQIAGDSLNRRETETFAESVERQKMRAKIQKKIDALEKKKRREVQFNIQIEIGAEIKRLKKELEKLA